MKSLNLILTSLISTAGLITNPSLYAGYSCYKQSGQTWCSGTLNGEIVDTQSYQSGGQTWTTGTYGGKSINQGCYEASGQTWCTEYY